MKPYISKVQELRTKLENALIILSTLTDTEEREILVNTCKRILTLNYNQLSIAYNDKANYNTIHNELFVRINKLVLNEMGV